MTAQGHLKEAVRAPWTGSDLTAKNSTLYFLIHTPNLHCRQMGGGGKPLCHSKQMFLYFEAEEIHECLVSAFSQNFKQSLFK